MEMIVAEDGPGRERGDVMTSLRRLTVGKTLSHTEARKGSERLA